jgi:hypothetical protein
MSMSVRCARRVARLRQVVAVQKPTTAAGDTLPPIG